MYVHIGITHIIINKINFSVILSINFDIFLKDIYIYSKMKQKIGLLIIFLIKN